MQILQEQLPRALRAGKLELPVLNSQAGAWELAHFGFYAFDQ